MKKISIILIIAFAVSCSMILPKISTKNGFGNLKLNMTLNEVIFEFDTSQTKSMSAYPNGNFEMEFDSLAVTKKIILKSVNLKFYQKKLGSITIESSDEIFEILKHQNGIKKDITDNYSKREVLFFTKSNNVECKYEKSPNEKGIITFYVK